MASSRARPTRRRREVGLTRRGWWFLAAAVVALFVGYVDGRGALLFVGYLLLALPASSIVVVWMRRPRLEVTRSFSPSIIPAGGSTTVSVAVHNLGARPSAPVDWVDTLPWYPYATEVAQLPRLDARTRRFGVRDRTAVEYELTPPHRGLFAIGPFLVSATDGFGMARSSSVVGEPQPLIVTPGVFPLSSAALTAPVGDGEATLVQRRAVGDDDVMTREYRSGDAMRRVHWRASARHGDLMVRQEESRSFPEARLLVDTQRDGYRDVATTTDDFDVESVAFEWVVEMLASSAVHLRRAGFLVTIEEAGVPQLDDLAHGRQRTWGDEEFLTRLATLSLTDNRRVRPARAHTSNGPLIALLGAPRADTVDWVTSHRRPGELAVAFVVHGLSSVDRIDRSLGTPQTASPVSHLLADAGWLVIPVRPDDDPSAAWEAIVAETERARGSS